MLDAAESDKGLRQSAVLVPIYERLGLPVVLFIKRSDRVGIHKGEIGFPGGRIEPDDHSPLVAALRETYEELGIAPVAVTPLGALPPVNTVVSRMVIHPFVGHLTVDPELRPDPFEVAETIEVPLATLLNPANYYTEEWTIRGAPRRVFIYRYQHYDIWGATGRIVQHLLDRLQRWADGPRDYDAWSLDDVAAALTATAHR